MLENNKDNNNKDSEPDNDDMEKPDKQLEDDVDNEMVNEMMPSVFKRPKRKTVRKGNNDVYNEPKALKKFETIDDFEKS